MFEKILIANRGEIALRSSTGSSVAEAPPLMEGRKAALLTLSYLGAVRTMPHYNVMGMAKASPSAALIMLGICR